MRRLLLTLVMATLFFSQGFSVAAAVCQHRSVRAHAMARESRDGAVAAAAFSEETAASVVEKKGSSFSGLTSTGAAVLPSTVLADMPQRVSGLQPWYTAGGPVLGRTEAEPLLRPPLAQSKKAAFDGVAIGRIARLSVLELSLKLSVRA